MRSGKVKQNKMKAMSKLGGKILFFCEYPDCKWKSYFTAAMNRHRNMAHNEKIEWENLKARLAPDGITGKFTDDPSESDDEPR